jgi:hypothetical protein
LTQPLSAVQLVVQAEAPQTYGAHDVTFVGLHVPNPSHE